MRVNARKRPIMCGNQVVMCGSGHEAEILFDCWLKQKAGLIMKLQFHPKFVFIVNGLRVGSFTADCSFIDREPKLHVIDAKGFKKSKKTGKLLARKDKGFTLRANLLKACFGIDVEIL